VVFPFHQEGGRGTRAFGDVLLDLARRLEGTGFNMPWPTMKDAVRASAQELQGLNRGSVRAADFEAFWISALQRGGWWDENFKGSQQAVSPPSLSELAGAPDFSGGMGDYPFYLIPFQSNSITDGRGANQPWLQAAPDPMTTATWETWVEINQRRADELDIKEGDILDIQSPSGTIRALAYPTPAAHPDVLSIPTGLGHTHYGNYEIGPDMSRTMVAKDRGSNVMSIVSPLKDGQTNALAWSATRVRINKTGEWVRLPKFEGTVPPQFSEGLFPLSKPA
jgi:molybdopterin-containing oxidoreductase family iron-sulfur binding subunit